MIAGLLLVLVAFANSAFIRFIAENFSELQQDRALSYSLELTSNFNMMRRNYMTIIGFAAASDQEVSYNLIAFNNSLNETVQRLLRSMESIRHTSHGTSVDEVYAQMQSLLYIISLLTGEYQATAQKMYNAILDGDMITAMDLAYLGVYMADSMSARLIDFVEFNQITLDARLSEFYERALSYSIFFFAQTIFIIAIIIWFMRYIDKNFKNPLVSFLEDMNELGKGNLNANTRKNAQDEMGLFYNHIESITSILRSLLVGLNNANENINNGEKNSHIDETDFRGAFKEIAAISNQVHDKLSQETDDIIKVLKEYNKGNFSVKIRRFHNEKSEIHETLDDLQKQLKLVNKEVTSLIQNVIAGSLDIRVTPENYKGDWQSAMTGLNYIMEHVERPINELEHVIASLSKGDTSARVRGNYYGKFSNMKSALNKVAETLDNKERS